MPRRSGPVALSNPAGGPEAPERRGSRMRPPGRLRVRPLLRAVAEGADPAGPQSSSGLAPVSVRSWAGSPVSWGRVPGANRIPTDHRRGDRFVSTARLLAPTKRTRRPAPVSWIRRLGLGSGTIFHVETPPSPGGRRVIQACSTHARRVAGGPRIADQGSPRPASSSEITCVPSTPRGAESSARGPPFAGSPGVADLLEGPSPLGRRTRTEGCCRDPPRRP